MIAEPEVIIGVEGAVGRFTLNRPAALGALTLGMVRDMTKALLAWAADPNIALVLIDHRGERGFSAGGDIRALYDSVNTDGLMARAFFREEYQLDHLLFEYPKPTCVIMDGVVMGGGSGIALPCRYRVATERTAFAMPETGIGLFPDVGGGWYLSRLPGRAGLWLALTGSRLKAADCLRLGLATSYVPAAGLLALKGQMIAAPDALEAILAEFAADPGPRALRRHRRPGEQRLRRRQRGGHPRHPRGGPPRLGRDHRRQVTDPAQGRLPATARRRPDGDLRRQHGHGVSHR